MQLNVPPDLETLIQRRLSSGAYTSVEDVLRSALKAQEDAWEAVGGLSDEGKPLKPFTSGYGMLAKYGPAPSAEEIDENRREMFHGFGEGF